MAVHSQVTILAIGLILFASVPSDAEAARDLCARTDFPDSCRPVVKGIRDPSKATNAAVSDLMWRTKAANPKSGKGAMSTCKSNFDSALDNLEKAMEDIKSGDGFSVSINLSAALTDYETCVDAVKEMGRRKGLSKVAETLRQMADNCLALSTLIGS